LRSIFPSEAFVVEGFTLGLTSSAISVNVLPLILDLGSRIGAKD